MDAERARQIYNCMMGSDIMKGFCYGALISNQLDSSPNVLKIQNAINFLREVAYGLETEITETNK